MKDMANGTVAADKDELAGSGRRAEGFKEMEHTLYSNVDHEVRRFLDGCHMNDVSDAGQRRFDGAPVGKRTLNYLCAVMRCNNAIITQGDDFAMGESGIGQKSGQEVTAQLSRRPGYKHFHVASRTDNENNNIY
jgi:hypothetical protein